MTNVLESDELKKIQVNGLDLVLILSNLTLEIAGEIPGDAQSTVAAIANRIDTMAKGMTDPRLNLLLAQFARCLIATERTA
jgi:hypothetical protein